MKFSVLKHDVDFCIQEKGMEKKVDLLVLTIPKEDYTLYNTCNLTAAPMCKWIQVALQTARTFKGNHPVKLRYCCRSSAHLEPNPDGSSVGVRITR